MASEYEIIETLAALVYYGVKKGIYTDEMTERYSSVMSDYAIYYRDYMTESWNDSQKEDILEEIRALFKGE